MNIFQLQILTIAILTSIAAVIPGIFLLLRGISLMSDAISHAILLGIALMFLFTQSLNSFWLLIGATIAGLATVLSIELLISSGRIKKDTAIGLVFPLFFSLGVIIISRYARNVHLDLDMVILGQLAFTPFKKLILFGTSWGPYALWLMAIIASLNSLLLFVFYKEIQLSTFDPILSHIFGFMPTTVYCGLMIITNITCVAAFDIVGAIVVTALMIAPPATAYLVTQRLPTLIYTSIVISVMGAFMGYFAAFYWDLCLSGTIACISGLLFLPALFFAPQKGLISGFIYKKKEKYDLLYLILLAYMKDKPLPIALKTVTEDLNLPPIVVKNTLAHKFTHIKLDNGFIMIKNNPV